MAKKTTKTTTKTVTKSSKKGLIIGISIAAVVAVAAAITIPLVLLKKPKEPTASLVMDTTEGDYGDFSYDGKKGEGNEINIAKFIGKKDFTIYFIPIDEYKDSKFTINIVGASFTATYSETDKKVNIKGERELENKTKLSATFTPEKPVPPVGETWTLKLDDNSTKYGDLKFKDQTADSVTIDEYIGETRAITMTFIPAKDYKTTQFTITADDQKITVGGYTPADEASFSIQKTDGFAGGDEITLHFVEPEPEVATFSIDSDTYGTLTYGEQSTTTSVDISDVIGEESVEITFVPETEYEGRDFTFTLDDTSASDFEIAFANNKITITGKGDRKFQDEDELEATVTLVEVATFSIDSDTYGTLTYGEQSTTTSVDISDVIGEESVEITFVPETEYEGRDFTFTLDDTSASHFEIAFANNKITITGKGGSTFQDGDNLTATVELVEIWTASLDEDSQDFGDLSLDGQTSGGESITVESFIGEEEAEIYFIPEEEYEETQFTVTAEDADKNELTANYSQDTGIVTLTKTEGTFADSDEITLHFEEPAVSPCFAIENVNPYEDPINLTLKKYSGTEEQTYAANIDYALESEMVGGELQWKNWDYNTTNTITIPYDDTVYFKGDNPNGFNKKDDSTTEILTFEYSGWDVYLKAHGNIMSLIDDGACNTLEIPNAYCFAGLFDDLSCLDLGKDFTLPATTLKEYCYYGMFSDCYSLTYAPDLPATIAPDGCYASMYYSCKKLKTVPKIDVTTIYDRTGLMQRVGQQFNYMFAATGITEIPDLSKIVNFTGEGEPTSTFSYMFYHCESLTKVEKDDMPVNNGIIYAMEFDWMFRECTNLESVDLSNISYTYDVDINSRYAFRQMFQGCSKLSYLKVGFGTPGEDTWPTYDDGWHHDDPYELTGDWLSAVDGGDPMQTSGTFVWKGKAIQPSETPSWARDGGHIPEGWTIETY